MLLWCDRLYTEKKTIVDFNFVDENQFLLRLLWGVQLKIWHKCNDWFFSRKPPELAKKMKKIFVVIGKFNNKEILWFSKWNQSTYSKQGSVSKAYLLEDIVQKSFHNLGLLRKFKLSKFNFWEIQGIPQSWFDLVWWVELIEYLNPQQGWSPIMIIHIWIKFIKIDI